MTSIRLLMLCQLTCVGISGDIQYCYNVDQGVAL